MDAGTILKDYGWLGFLLIWMLDKLFPRLWSFLTDKVFPSRVGERNRQLKLKEQEIKSKTEESELLLKAKIERELREEDHRRKIEERMVAAQEQTAQNIQQMSLAITVTNERLSQLIADHIKHDTFTIDAVNDMNKTVIAMHKRGSQSKATKKIAMHKRGSQSKATKK